MANQNSNNKSSSTKKIKPDEIKGKYETKTLKSRDQSAIKPKKP